MRRMFSVLVCAAACAAIAACGKSPQDKKVEEVKKGADQVQKSADQMAKGLEDMAKGLQALSGGDPNQPAVDPVSFRELQTAFGDLGGWEKGKPTGERMTSPVNYSVAKISYAKGDARIEEEISDSAFNQMLLVPFSMFLTSGYEKETEDGYEKSAKIGEYPGFEKWNKSSKSGELTAIVNKRFIVQVNGHDIPDPKVLQDAMASIDLKKLASLK
jgi:predicted small lipoprotein YifL